MHSALVAGSSPTSNHPLTTGTALALRDPFDLTTRDAPTAGHIPFTGISMSSIWRMGTSAALMALLRADLPVGDLDRTWDTDVKTLEMLDGCTNLGPCPRIHGREPNAAVAFQRPYRPITAATARWSDRPVSPVRTRRPAGERGER